MRDMKTIRTNATRLSFETLTVLLIFALAATAQTPSQKPVRYDAGTISGLKARNIGSATMSGRIAAVDAVDENGKITAFVGSASGGVWKSINGGITYTPVFYNQDVRSIGAVTRGSGWGAANRGRAIASPWAMVSTNPLTMVRTGPTWD